MGDDARTQNEGQSSAQTRRERFGEFRRRASTFATRPSIWPMALAVLGAAALLLLLMWGWPRIFGRAGEVARMPLPTIDVAATSPIRVDAAGTRSGGAGAGGASEPVPTVAPGPPVLPGGPGPQFADFYQQRGGIAVFGLPISDPMMVNGRTVQWFERARLELWPEFAGTPYAVQSGRLGVEFTQGRAFPQQSFFPSRPDLRFFPETGHAVGEPFLSFWAQNGGLDVFGYPISDAVPENLPDGQLHTVQYFERARLEQHGNQVLVGLLGSALFRRDRDTTAVATPAIVTVPPPTPVPIQ